MRDRADSKDSLARYSLCSPFDLNVWKNQERTANNDTENWHIFICNTPLPGDGTCPKPLPVKVLCCSVEMCAKSSPALLLFARSSCAWLRMGGGKEMLFRTHGLWIVQLHVFFEACRICSVWLASITLPEFRTVCHCVTDPPLLSFAALLHRLPRPPSRPCKCRLRGRI